MVGDKEKVLDSLWEQGADKPGTRGLGDQSQFRGSVRISLKS